MSFFLLLAGIAVLLPIAIPLTFFIAAAADFLAGGGRSATKTGSNEDRTIGLDPLRDIARSRRSDGLQSL